MGNYYLRLLLEGEGGNAPPLREPGLFFGALYHRFLCEADAGMCVEGGEAWEEPAG